MVLIYPGSEKRLSSYKEVSSSKLQPEIIRSSIGQFPLIVAYEVPQINDETKEWRERDWRVWKNSRWNSCISPRQRFSHWVVGLWQQFSSRHRQLMQSMGSNDRMAHSSTGTGRCPNREQWNLFFFLMFFNDNDSWMRIAKLYPNQEDANNLAHFFRCDEFCFLYIIIYYILQIKTF